MRKSYSVIESLNWYAYVSNNPVRYVDPTGKSGIAIGGAAATAAFLEPTPIGEIIIIGAIILGWALSKAKAPEDGVVVEPEKPEDDTVPSEAPDEAATPDTPKPTIEDPQEKDRDIDDHDNPKEWPENPDDWTPPEGVEETPSKEETDGRHRQWSDKDGNIVRWWDREDAPGGKPRGPHWHDSEKRHTAPGGEIID